MSRQRIYLDHNATTPPRAEVVKAMLPYLGGEEGLFGNPSSVHTFGQEARKAVEAARAKVAALIGADPDEIVFTSCGSESDSLAIKGTAYSASERGKGRHIVTTSIEHDTVLFLCQYLQKQGWDVTFLPVDSGGLVDPDDVKRALRPDTVLVSAMHVNNEIGTIEPVAEIGRVCRERGVTFHTDAVQSVGRIAVNVDELNADLLSLSAHKFYGPKGVGALYVRKGTRLHPLFHGHHEKNRRAGTENVAGIVGCGVAAACAAADMADSDRRIQAMRDRLEKGILEKIPCALLNGHPTRRISTTSNFSFEFVEGEGCVVLLDVEGIAVSTGSACASGTTKASHVLRAIGVPGNVAQGAVRFSLGSGNTEAEIDRVLELLPAAVERLRSISPLWADRKAGAATRISVPDKLRGEVR